MWVTIRGPSQIGHLERELAAVEHGLDKGVCGGLEVGLGALARGQELLQDLRQDALRAPHAHERVPARAAQHVLRRHLAHPARARPKVNNHV